MAQLTAKQKKRLLDVSKADKIDSLQGRMFSEAEMLAFGERLILSYLASSLVTLRDQFGFSKVRIERFLTGESNHAQAIKDGNVTADQILRQIKVETGFDLQVFIKQRSEEMAIS